MESVGFLASSGSPLDGITSVFESAYIIYLLYYIADSIFYMFVSSLPLSRVPAHSRFSMHIY